MEKYRKNIYCKKQFLKSYFQFKENDVGNDNDVKKQMLECIENIIDNRHVKLHLDITNEEIEDIKKKNEYDKEKMSEYDKFIIELLEKQHLNETHLKIDYNKLDLDALYLTDDPLDKEQCERSGVTAITIDNLFDYCFAMKDQGKAIAKGDDVFKSWKRVFKHTKFLPRNAMIIIDNYLLNNTDSFPENIESILDLLIPDQLEVPFHIAIITSLGGNNNKNNLPCKCRYEKIKGYIQSIRPNIDFELTIFKRNPYHYNEVGAVFHDRTIITNSMFIGCGAGFDLFKDKKSQKTTVVNVVVPLFSNKNIEWGITAYSNLINDIKTKVWLDKNVPQFDGDKIGESMHSFYIGKKTNRIIESQQNNSQ